MFTLREAYLACILVTRKITLPLEPLTLWAMKRNKTPSEWEFSRDINSHCLGSQVSGP